MDEWGLIRPCINEEQEADVSEYFKKNGFVETVCHLYDSVWTDKEKETVEKDIKDRNNESKYYKLLFEKPFNMKEHINQTDSHKMFIKKAYNRLKDFVPNMTENDAEIHDLSKYSLAQCVGYTARWVHNIDNQTWQIALKDHYKNESHHPQYHEPEKMSRATLEESLIDMVASRWERNLNGDEAASNYDLVDFDPKYLLRYKEEDRIEVDKLINAIKSA